MGVASVLGLVLKGATIIAQRAQAKKAAAAQRESRAVETSGQQIENNLARRKAAREERVRRSRIIAASANEGTAGSSGEVGAISALGTNFGSAVSEQTSQVRAAEGISAANQRAADAQQKFDFIGSFGNLVQEGLDLFDQAKQA